MRHFSPTIGLISLMLLSFALHFPIFKQEIVGVHAWRQSQTQLNIQNFYRRDNNIFHPRNNNTSEDPKGAIQRMEFPIMQWTIAQVYYIFGEHLAITRICIFLIGCASMWGFFLLIRILFNDDWLALMATWSFTFSPIFFYYTVNPLPDNLALCAGIWSLAHYFRFRKTNNVRYLWSSAAWLSLAALAKLPFVLFGAVYFAHACVLLIQRRAKFGANIVRFLGIYALCALPALMWYVWVIPTWNGNGVIKGMFDHPISNQKYWAIWDYHRHVMFPKLLINWGTVAFFVVGAVAFFSKKRYLKARNIELAVGGLFLFAYLTYELNMIDTVHSYYMMPFLPFLFIIVAMGLKMMQNIRNIELTVGGLLLLTYLTYELNLIDAVPDYSMMSFLPFLFIIVTMGLKMIKNIKTSIVQFATVILLLLLPMSTYFAVYDYWSLAQEGCNPALILYQEELRRAAPNDAPCIMLNDDSGFHFPYHLDKYGQVFTHSHLPTEWIADMIHRQGLRYMYSDCRAVDERPDVQPYLDSLVLQRGSIRVFRLKK